VATYGYYDITLPAGASPLAWFRTQVAARGGDRVEVDAQPGSLDALAAFVAAHRVTFDHASVFQTSTTSAAADDLQRLQRELPPLCSVHVALRRGEECTPWKAIGLRKRKVLRATQNVEMHLETGYTFAWLSLSGLPTLSVREVAVYEAWRDAQEAEHLARGLARLGVDRLPARRDWREVRTADQSVDAGDALPLRERIVMARPQGSGTGFLFPSTCALTVAIPAGAAAPGELAAALLSEPALPHELEILAGGTVAELCAASRCWPAPSEIHAPEVEPIASGAVEVPAGYVGGLSFRAELAIGPRGSETEVTLELRDKGAPRLSVAARWGLDDPARKRIEQALGVTLSLAFVG
jgi:hypothetical protein